MWTNPAEGAGVASWDVFADLNGSNQVQVRYLRGDGVDETDARTSSGAAVVWYLPDHLGTIRDITNSTGSVVDHLDYDGFGNTSTTPTGGDRCLFTSREYDSESGLYYGRQRYYNPSLGRWQSEDTAGLGVDSNPYRYVGNSPTNYIEPTGLDRKSTRLNSSH